MFESGTSSAPFLDVPPGNLFFGEIHRLRAEGVTQGCNATGTNYYPKDPVTRAQMAVFLVHAFGL